MLVTQTRVDDPQRKLEQRIFAVVAGSAGVTGSRVIPSEEIDRAFGMPPGKLRDRAGIESLAYASDGETELTLGARAARQALESGEAAPREADWIIATSETYHRYPSLAAQLHLELGVREGCGALDVGGACLGLLNALAAAQSFILAGQARSVIVVTADVHSRTLVPGRVAGEFGGLFGDGASAFFVRSAGAQQERPAYRLHEFLFGCATQYSGAVEVAGTLTGALDVIFDGEALSRAAIHRMEKVIAGIENLSGIPRGAAGAFATHQPNPRLLGLIGKVAGIPLDAFPAVARKSGNLGSSTCGAALHAALAAPAKPRKPIFLASLGPGLLYGGTWLSFPGQEIPLE